MSADTQQILANTASLQAINDNAKEINDLTVKQTDASNTDSFAIQTEDGQTLRIPLSSLSALIQATGATTINYASIKPPQLYNPDAGEVTAGTGDYTLSALGFVAFVTLNGQVLDDSEYSLSLTTLTVTPDNGFADTDDEILVFQQAYSSTSSSITYTYVEKTANYTIVDGDYYINCTANTFDVTLPNPATVGEGVTFVIKNMGSGTITVKGTIDGVVDATLSQYESLTLVSTGAAFIIV